MTETDPPEADTPEPLPEDLVVTPPEVSRTPEVELTLVEIESMKAMRLANEVRASRLATGAVDEAEEVPAPPPQGAP